MGYLNHDALVKTANELPPLPQAVIRLSEILSDIDYLVRDVVRVVELEPALSGKLLRMANSVVYGGGKVSTDGEAVVRLGAGTVRSIAISASAKPSLDLNLSPFGHTPMTYWRHCVAVLSFAKEMAAQRVAAFGDEFPTAALLHDFGKLVLPRHLTSYQVERLRSLDPALPSVDREMLVLGVNHAEVTAVVLQAWNISDTMVRAVQYHHSPTNFSYPICHGLNLANQLAWKLEDRGFERHREHNSRVSSMAALSLSEEQMDGIQERGLVRFEAALEVYC